MPIPTLDDLREHLQWAIKLEHSTIPPYLCALYSIKPGSNQEAAEVITSVVIEEMLHMMLAANVLNAVGGAPVLDDPGFIATYPTYLPHSADAFLVSLAPFTRGTIETFMKIERPEEPDASPEEDRFDTIGQFYQAIEEGLKSLCDRLGEETVFIGDPARQVTADTFQYRGGGRVVPVHDLASALEAIDEIEEQGEGLKHVEVWDGDRALFHPERDEVAHYFRYDEIMRGRSYQRGDTPEGGPTGDAFEVDWDAVYPMREDPRLEDYAEDSPVRIAMDAFNSLYSNILRTLQHALNGEPEVLFAAVAQMIELRERARELMKMPSGDGVTTAGPSFDHVPAGASMGASGEVSPITIRIRKDGPYVVEGGSPLVRKAVVESEWGEPLTWRKYATLPTAEMMLLCRCGQSEHKPFCDGSHLRVHFDGTETAPTEPSSERRKSFPGPKVTLTDDAPLCSSFGFCHNRVEGVWKLVKRADDSQVLFQMMHMVEQCPSGRLLYELEDGALEPDLPREIAVTKDGPYWVTGEIPVTMSDGRTLEVRNRVTLCRCGRSSNKPFCDGTHGDVGFEEG